MSVFLALILIADIICGIKVDSRYSDAGTPTRIPQPQNPIGKIFASYSTLIWQLSNRWKNYAFVIGDRTFATGRTCGLAKSGTIVLLELIGRLMCFSFFWSAQ